MRLPAPPSKAAGFTLIELMIAMVLGLIVIGAVLALSLSMIRANSGTISSTRLTQELRGTAAAISSELQRAGSTGNPYDITAAVALGTVNLSDSNRCVRYRYSEAGATVQRAISFAGGAVYLGTTTCGNGGTKLSSNQVNITGLQFTCNGRALSLSVTGQLPGNAAVYRQYSQTVFAPGLGSGATTCT